MNKKPRGKDMDSKIKEICENYLDTDPRIVPITRSLVQRELNLKSRSTLVGSRAEIIQGYADLQRRKFNLTKTGSKSRSKDLQIEKLKKEITQLKLERDQAISDYCAILNGLKIRGINIEDVFYPVFGEA